MKTRHLYYCIQLDSHSNGEWPPLIRIRADERPGSSEESLFG